MSFTKYRSLEDRVVLISGGASGQTFNVNAGRP
jgi:hypothetical protein